MTQTSRSNHIHGYTMHVHRAVNGQCSLTPWSCLSAWSDFNSMLQLVIFSR